MPKILPDKFFSDWKAWGFPVFVDILAPWQDKLTNAKLISDWFQPDLSIVASIVGPLTTFVAYGILQSKAKRTIKRSAIVSLLLFLLLLVLCLVFKYTVDIIWFPTHYVQILVWIVWVIFYLFLFVSFGVTLISGALLIKL